VRDYVLDDDGLDPFGRATARRIQLARRSRAGKACSDADLTLSELFRHLGKMVEGIFELFRVLARKNVRSPESLAR